MLPPAIHSLGIQPKLSPYTRIRLPPSAFSTCPVVHRQTVRKVTVAHDVVPVGDDVEDIRSFAWRCDPLSSPVFVELLPSGTRLVVDDGLAEIAVCADAYVISAAKILHMVHVAYEVGAAWPAVRRYEAFLRRMKLPE
jgi:hypothetical protein